MKWDYIATIEVLALLDAKSMAASAILSDHPRFRRCMLSFWRCYDMVPYTPASIPAGPRNGCENGGTEASRDRGEGVVGATGADAGSLAHVFSSLQALRGPIMVFGFYDCKN